MVLSMETNEQINEVTMPKTMKMLFCSICLIYDCGQHSLDSNTKEVNQKISRNNFSMQVLKIYYLNKTS